MASLTFLSSGRRTFPEKEDRMTTTTIERPSVLPQSESVAQPDPVLLRAAQIVRERGLRKGPWKDGGPICAAGAVGAAGEDLILTRPEMEQRVLRFAQALGGSVISDVHRWNDTPGRTTAEVAEALERAAYGV
jgi:hypothetical protein